MVEAINSDYCYKTFTPEANDSFPKGKMETWETWRQGTYPRSWKHLPTRKARCVWPGLEALKGCSCAEGRKCRGQKETARSRAERLGQEPTGQPWWHCFLNTEPWLFCDIYPAVQAPCMLSGWECPSSFPALLWAGGRWVTPGKTNRSLLLPAQPGLKTRKKLRAHGLDRVVYLLSGCPGSSRAPSCPKKRHYNVSFNSKGVLYPINFQYVPFTHKFPKMAPHC
jgi:hypothetical protein